MTLPGVFLSTRESAPSRTNPTDSGAWFVAGMTDRGDHTIAQLITSLTQFEELYGGSVSYGYTWDALDVFFREGGARAYVGRVVGPDPEFASAVLYDQADSAPSDVALDVTAVSVGDWANSLNVSVLAGDAVGEFKIQVTHDDDGTLETSPSLATRADAVAWAAASSDYISIALGVSNEDPRTQGPTSLAGGDDDRSNATDAEWVAALDLFGVDLGNGQVSMPGRTTDQAHQDLLEHATAKNRTALLDLTDDADESVLIASADAMTDLGEISRYGGAFAPWAIVPGIAPGTTRTVPYSAVQAGIIARNDGAGITPNQPSAGDLGISRYAVGLTQSYTDAQRESLNDAGVNISLIKSGLIKTYGYRTLTDAINDADWIGLANVRLLQEIKARANAIGEGYVFRQIDGRNITISQFGGELRSMLKTYWEANALYGATQQDAFLVDVGATVNTPATIAQNELRAVLAVKMSPFGEVVRIEIVKVRIEDSLV